MSADLDALVRKAIYDSFLTRGRTILRAEVAAQLGVDSAQVTESFRRLADAHMLALQSNEEVLMAFPFSAVATPFKVRAGAQEWWANCIWDALGVAAMIRGKAVIESFCPDCGEALALAVTSAGPRASEAVAHFAVPAAHWWDDIVFT